MNDTADLPLFETPGLPEGRWVELPGRGVTFIRETEGPPGAATLLLLHGWTATSALNWFAAFGPLSERFHVVAMDHRGHGRGLRTWRRFTLEDCADDAAALLRELGTGTAIPVGYSMGGPVAQLIWRRHRELVDGLVLCCTAARFRDARGERAMQGVATGLSFAARATPPWMHRRVSERVLVSKYDTSPLGTWAREQARQHDLRAMIDAGHALGSFDSRDWVETIDVPTAVVATRFDTTVLTSRQVALAEAIPGARTWFVSGGHDVCAVDPDSFVPVLLEAATDVAVRAGKRVTQS
ncbi:MAG TPA: alpha/beta fold hydrolase [Acidimicrobiales bacterium]